MPTEQAKQGLTRILEISCPNKVKILGKKTFPALPYHATHEEITEAIAKQHAHKPSKILCKKKITRDTIVAYLEEIGIRVQEELPKEACIRMCLEQWNVKDDKFWVKHRRSNKKSSGDINGLDKYLNRKAEDVDQAYQKKTMKILESVQEENLFHHLNNQREEEEEVQIMPPAVAHTKSPSKESLENLYIRNVSSWTGISEHVLALPTTSQIGSKSSGSADKSPTLVSDSFAPAVSSPESSQSISLLEPPRCSSAPVFHYNHKQSTHSSKNQNSFSLGHNLSSQPLFRETPSTEPFSVSPDSLDMINQSSADTMEGEDGSVPVYPSSSSVRFHQICKTARESPEPPPIKQCSSSPHLMKTANEPPVGIVEDTHRSVPISRSTSLCFPEMSKTVYESPEVRRPSTSKLLAHSVSVSNASVQTSPSEILGSQDNRSTVWQTNAGNVCSTEKELSPEKMQNYKRGHLEHPLKKNTLLYQKNRDLSPSLSKRKYYTAGFPAAKRNRKTSSPDPDFRNGSQSTFLKCPNCTKHYCSPFNQSKRSESGVLPKSQDYKKKILSSLSKNARLPQKRRVNQQPKQRKETSDTSVEIGKASTKAKTLKRKYPALSSSGDHNSRRQPTSSKVPRCPPAISSEHHKKSKLSLISVNYEAVAKPQNEDSDSSESSADILPPENRTDKITDPPSRSSSVQPELSSVSESKLKTKDCSSDTSDDNSSPGIPSSPALEKSRPKRYCCALI